MTEAEPALAREEIGLDCPSLPPEIITKALFRATETSCNTKHVHVVDFKNSLANGQHVLN